MKKLQNKLQEKLQNRKQNNKGFSLVELIIVIAIMAILVGIVGTQVIPYIEKSRKAKDIQVLSAMCTDAMTAYSSNADKLTAASYTIEVAADGTTCADATLRAAFVELNGYDTAGPSYESNAGKDISKVVITVNPKAASGSSMITVAPTMKDGSKYSFETITSK